MNVEKTALMEAHDKEIRNGGSETQRRKQYESSEDDSHLTDLKRWNLTYNSLNNDTPENNDN